MYVEIVKQEQTLFLGALSLFGVEGWCWCLVWTTQPAQ